MRERNVLASNDFRLRCDARRSFRRAIRGEFLNADAMFLSTRCFSRTFSKFGSEAGQFFQPVVSWSLSYPEEGGARGAGGEERGRTKGKNATRDDPAFRDRVRVRSLVLSIYRHSRIAEEDRERDSAKIST